MAKNFVTNLVIGGKLNPSLAYAFNKASRMANQSSMKLSSLGRLAGRALGAVGVAVSGAAVASVAKEGIELASNLAEVQNVIDTTFGDSAGKINKWSQTALKSFGLSELQAKQFNGTMGAMLKSSGVSGDAIVKMSEKLSGLSGDMASFYNLSQDEAFEKIRAGISGETEPLKQLGINMSVANLEAYALSKGITTSYSKMDQASQTALRYSYLMNVTKDAQGDFAKTQGSFANQSRLLKTNIQQLVSKLMSGMLPTLTKLAQKGNDLIDKFTGDPARLQIMQDKIQGVVDKIGDGFNAAVSVYTFIRDNWSLIGPIIVGIVSAMTAWKAITLGMMVYKGIMAVASAYTMLQSGATMAATAAQWGLNAAVLANPMTWIIVGIIAAIGLLSAGIYVLWKNWDKVSVAAKKMWTGIKGAFANGVNWVIDKLNFLIEKINLIPGIKIPLIAKIQTITEKNSTVGRGYAEFAEGGIASVPSIFGEKGPEIAIPLKRTPRSMGLLSQANKMLGGGSGNSIQFIYSPQVPGSTRPEVEQALKENFEMFKVWIEQYFADKEALSFGSV